MTDAELDELFTYQNPTNIDPCRFDEIRLNAKKLAWSINENGGWSEDKKRAIMKLRECVFFAIASIVFEGNDEKMPY